MPTRHIVNFDKQLFLRFTDWALIGDKISEALDLIDLKQDYGDSLHFAFRARELSERLSYCNIYHHDVAQPCLDREFFSWQQREMSGLRLGEL